METEEIENVEEEMEDEDELSEEEFSSEEKVRIMATAADSLRADAIVALDLRELTIIADFFLICTGNSSIQIRAIADRIEERMREQGLHKLRVEGYQEATWILLDYGDVVVHVMAAEQRAFYNLEKFWEKAPRLELDLRPE
jgi:ribosome-associated protein